MNKALDVFKESLMLFGERCFDNKQRYNCFRPCNATYYSITSDQSVIGLKILVNLDDNATYRWLNTVDLKTSTFCQICDSITKTQDITAKRFKQLLFVHRILTEVSDMPTNVTVRSLAEVLEEGI